MESCFHECVVNANGRDLNAELLNPEIFCEFLLDGVASLRTQTAHSLFRVVARERGQVHAGYGAKKPGRLPFLLYCAPRDLRLGASFDGAGIHAQFLNPIQIEWNAAVANQRLPVQRCHGIVWA